MGRESVAVQKIITRMFHDQMCRDTSLLPPQPHLRQAKRAKKSVSFTKISLFSLCSGEAFCWCDLSNAELYFSVIFVASHLNVGRKMYLLKVYMYQLVRPASCDAAIWIALHRMNRKSHQ